MLFCNLHHPLKERQLDTVSGRVGGKIEHQHFGLGIGIANRGLQFLKETRFALHRYVAQICTRDHKSIGVNRVAGIRHQNRVAHTGRGQSQVRQTLFGAQRDDRFRFRVERYRVTILVPVADRFTESGDAFGLGVTVRVAALNRLTQLLYDVWRCRLIGVAHTKINDVFSTRTRGLLQFTDDIEDVGRETLNALKMGIHGVDARFTCRLIEP